MKIYIRICLLFLLTLSARADSFDKVIIWGYKLHTHTHSYVHNAFYRAFDSLGYKVYWFDDKDNLNDFDFSNSLFLTVGEQEKNIPIRNDCDYILHNCVDNKYHSLLETGQCIALQVYTNDILAVPNIVKVAPCIYYDVPGSCLYMPWATDLLPHEIDTIKTKILTIKKRKKVHWIGTIGDGKFGNIHELHGFKSACLKNGIKFIHHNPWGKGISVEDNMNLTMRSYLAPTIVGKWQQEKGYIPCRIFKNISYGQIGITNSMTVWELFERKIIFNTNTYQLFFDAKNYLRNMTMDMLYEQMDFVKTKHTYINRIQTILDFFSLVKERKNELLQEQKQSTLIAQEELQNLSS